MVMEVLRCCRPNCGAGAARRRRFATSDLNDLYRRVINRNKPVKRLLELKAPESSCATRSACCRKRLTRCSTTDAAAAMTAPKRPLKSLADMIKGKGGRFRQNLLGKRVDYSGVGHRGWSATPAAQCGCRRKWRWSFSAVYIPQTEVLGLATTIKAAKRLVEQELPELGYSGGS